MKMTRLLAGNDSLAPHLKRGALNDLGPKVIAAEIVLEPTGSRKVGIRLG